MKLLSNVIEARNKYCKDHRTPLLLKISPDLTDQDKTDIANVVNDKKVILFLVSKEILHKLIFLFQYRVDGLIISNTTITRAGVYDNPNSLEPGGLSGKPLQETSTKLISEFYKLTNGN